MCNTGAGIAILDAIDEEFLVTRPIDGKPHQHPLRVGGKHSRPKNIFGAGRVQIKAEGTALRPNRKMPVADGRTIARCVGEPTTRENVPAVGPQGSRLNPHFQRHGTVDSALGNVCVVKKVTFAIKGERANPCSIGVRDIALARLRRRRTSWENRFPHLRAWSQALGVRRIEVDNEIAGLYLRPLGIEIQVGSEGERRPVGVSASRTISSGSPPDEGVSSPRKRIRCQSGRHIRGYRLCRVRLSTDKVRLKRHRVRISGPLGMQRQPRRQRDRLTIVILNRPTGTRRPPSKGVPGPRKRMRSQRSQRVWRDRLRRIRRPTCKVGLKRHRV